MLLPEMRGNLRHANGFLTEAKLTATMDHPRIVNFAGVAWNALSDLCVALEFMTCAHYSTITHHNFKSRNILLTDTIEAKLTDVSNSRERLDNTMAANVGTLLWMSPEVMLGEHCDMMADMFSFGIVLLELD
ncbi:hypothetical protein BBJ29_008970 [Phytophthora kernoviae]|uniref:Protein kinase domain-containing protein n=1 Tax=Phytophthora kernoviae TaxID=325452 RepID=A0A3F2RNU3_9STRA|nr:hypothetical protein BBP00_00005465 [Phytophthora kernoviae]RLN68486.1 hypothetical protein BBJ29_008970 [Phytophthora kernoviae]